MPITLPYNIANGQAIDATPVMANFTALANAINALQTEHTLIATTVFDASGTHTPNAATKLIEWELWGGGGAAGGAPATSSTQFSIGTPGGAGSYGRGITTTISAQTVTVGAAGAPAAGAAGGTGGNSGYGSIAIAPGGGGGMTQLYSSTAGQAYTGGGASGGACTGSGTFHINIPGNYGLGVFAGAAQAPWGQSGTPGPYGGAPTLVGSGSNGAGAPANSGAGGGGSANATSGAARSGGAGGTGKVIIREYT